MSTSLSGLSTNFFPSAQNGFTTTLASTIASGAATVPLNSVSGYTNGQIAVFVVDPTDVTKKQTFSGVVDTAGVQLTSVVWTAGTNQTHTAGSTVVDYATATHISMITKGITQQHTQAGAHGAVTATSLTTTGAITEGNTALATERQETYFDHVASGLVWSGLGLGTTLTATMTAGVAYINGQRLAISSVATRTFTASKDTYIDILNTAGVGSIVYTEVANNAASPALAANSLRIGIVVSGANIAAATSINQGQVDRVLPIASSIAYTTTDSLGNLICPRDPQHRVLGYKQIISTFTVPITQGDVTGLSCPVIVPTGRRIKITQYWSRVTNVSGSNAETVGAILDEGSNTIFATNGPLVLPSSSSSGFSPSVPITPTAGSHTYRMQASNTGSASLVTITALTGFGPAAHILVELV